MLEKFKKLWKRIDESWIGYIVYAILGIASAYLLNTLLSFLLNTKMPLVVVVSNSMSHFPNSNLCGNLARGYKIDFDYYWLLCNHTYKAFNITKEMFFEFPFRNGLEIGDVIVVKGEENYRIGDVIVYKPNGSKYSIIHRIVAQNEDGSWQTKGDRNNGQFPYEKSVKKDQIYGRAVVKIPLIGWPRVLVNWLVGI